MIKSKSEIKLDLDLEFSEGQRESMTNFLLDCVDSMRIKMPSLLITEHAEKYRIIKSGPKRGRLSFVDSAYLIKPGNLMAPFSPVQHVSVMKAAQGGWTMLLECILAYYMHEYPVDSLFMASSQDTLERWASRRLESMIEDYDLRQYIYAQYASRNSRRSGDKTFSKEYHGCRLDLVSMQAVAQIRGMDKLLLIRDDIDGAPPQLKTGEGNFMDVSFVRTNSYADRRKVMDVGTPGLESESLIYPEYLKGDQQKFHVPCLACGTKQVLVFENFHPIMLNGQLKDAIYIPPCCGEEIHNYDKPDLIRHGEWKPTAKSVSPFHVSFHWPSFYAPSFMLTWRGVYEEYLKTRDDPEGDRTFKNLYLGEPYKPPGRRPKLEVVNSLRQNYKMGEVPEGVVFLTFAVDVQRGNQKGETRNKPARLELKAWGHGSKYRGWTILYKVFEGAIDNAYDGAWEKLYQWIMEEDGLTFKRRDGVEFQTAMGLIDSGDGMFYDVVYAFCERIPNVFPLKGSRDLLKKDKQKGRDEIGKDIYKRYYPSRIPSGRLYTVVSNYYRRQLYARLERTYKLLDKPRPDKEAGFLGFPRDYTDEQFKQLTAYDELEGGSFEKYDRPAEGHDVTIYNLCAGDIWLDEYIKERVDALVKMGANQYKAEDTYTKTLALIDMQMEKGDATEEQITQYRSALESLS